MSKLKTVALSLGLTAFGLAGCAEEGLDLDESQVESGAAALEASTAGVKWAGDFHLKSATGVCAVDSGAVLTTAPCSNAGNRIFTVYQMPDGNYELCKRNTTRTYEYIEYDGSIAGAFSVEVAGYEAQCLHGGDGVNSNGSDLRFRNIRLTRSERFLALPDSEPFTTAAAGVIQNAGGGILRYLRRHAGNITVNNSGVVVIGNLGGGDSQKWSVY